MRVRGAKSIGSISLMMLLVATIPVIIMNSGDADAVEDASASAGASSTSSDEVVVASGSNRFVVWQDDTPGNNDILFRRSTDNGATWKPVKNLSDNPGASISPRIAVSGSSVYVMWIQFNAMSQSPNVFFRGSTDNGATWGPKINISVDGVVATLSSNCCASEISASGSFVYIAWLSPTDEGNPVFFRRSTDNGATWQARTFPTCPAPWGIQALESMTASGSKVYILCRTNDHPNDTTLPEVVFSRSTDNGATWKPFVNLSSDFELSEDAQIAASGSNVYVVWRDGTPGNFFDIFFRRSTDNGATWKSVRNLSNNPGSSGNPQVAVSGSNVYVAWEQWNVDGDQFDVFFKRSTDNGSTWEFRVNLSNTGPLPCQFCGSFGGVDLAVSGSNVYIGWVDSDPVNENIPGPSDILFRRSTDSGATWKSINNLSDNLAKSLGPQIAVSGTNVYVVWHDEVSPDSDYDILLRRTTDSGATWSAKKNLSDNGGESLSAQIAA